MMNWFDIIKRAIEDESVIWKAPPPYTETDRRYLMAQLDDIPGLVAMLSKQNNPLVNIKQQEGIDLFPRNTEIRIYPVYEELGNTGDDMKVFNWKTTIGGRKATQMLVTILDKEGKPINPWIMGALTTPQGMEASQKLREVASGTKSFELQEDEIGINIMYSEGTLKTKYRAIIDGFVGFGGEYWKALSGPQTMTTGAMADDYDLTNGAAAILLVLTQIVPFGQRGRKGQHQERVKEIESLGLGTWGRDVDDNKYVNELVDKGLLERRRSQTKGLNRLPVPTAKGKAVSNRFEMKHDYFDNEFRNEVRSNPDEPFDSFESSDLQSDDPDFGV